MRIRIIKWLLVVFGIILSINVAWASNLPRENQRIISIEGSQYLLEEEVPVETDFIKGNGDLIIVELNASRLTLYQNGVKIKSYPVASGKPTTPSPVGEWHVIDKGVHWGSGFGERWMGLNVPWGRYGIHGTNDPSSIGRRASHGCIRMFNRDVCELYKMVEIGMAVHIVGDFSAVTLRREYQRKSTGQDLQLVQLRLREKGFDAGDLDGRFGRQMEETVLEMQRFYGLPLNGKIGLSEQYLLGLR